jgi:hypothetical protein
MGALHNASGGYYSGNGTTNPATQSPSGYTSNGHPDDVWGWAIGGGFRLNNFLMPKDRFEFQATYAKGATGYVTGQNQGLLSGRTLSYGFATDGIYVTGSDVELTESWNLQFGYEHYWNAQWRTSIYDTYAEVNYSDTAAARMCGTALNANATAMGAVTPTNCTPSFSSNNLSTRTAWNPHPSLEIGLDLIWAHFNTGFKGLGTLNASTAGLTAGPLTIDDQDRYLAVLRVQKTILP